MAETVPAGDGRPVRPPMPPVVHREHCVPQLAQVCRVVGADGTVSDWCLFCGADVIRFAGALWAPQS